MRYLLAADADAARQLVAGLNTDIDGFCRLSKLRPSKEGGYVQLSHGGGNKFATLQEGLVWAQGLHLSEGMHISHLCDKPRCTIPEHVVLETPIVNNSRKNCGLTFDCTHCEKKILACKHNPKCISYVAGFPSWEEFLASEPHTP
jgi:hypothetical protein